MNDQTISREYANDIIFELEKAFWDERGKGARFRVTTVGSDFFRTRCLPELQSVEIEEIVQAVERALQEEGIVKQVSVEIDGRLLRVRIEGCAHRSVEDRLVAQGTKPFTCVPANLIVSGDRGEAGPPGRARRDQAGRWRLPHSPGPV